MRSDLFLTQRYVISDTKSPQWYTELQLSFNKNVMLDRHYLFDIESHVCIAKLIIIDKEDNKIQDYGNDYLQLILARDYALELNFRELPVALLRLHFAGHDRFMVWLHRIPLWDIKILHGLARQDDHVVDMFRYGGNNDDDYDGQIKDIKEYLIFLIDMCFCSFERTLYHFLNSEKWPTFGLEDALLNDSYWKNFPTVSKDNVIWYVCVWRMHISRMIEKYLKPWRPDDENEQKEWVTYRMRLFRDTHLDLLTKIVSKGLYEDEALISTQLFYDNYPNAHRVCCAEELPCLVGYTFDNYKTGSNLKERRSLKDRIGHIVTNKPMPNICKVRNVHKIIRRYGNSDKVIFDLVKHIVRCVLLGNLPHAQGNLDIMARIRLNRAMNDDMADTVIPKAETDLEAIALEKKKKKEAKEAKKRKKEGKTEYGDATAKPVSGKKRKANKQKKNKKKKKKKKDDGDDDEDDDDDDDDLDEKDETVFTRWLYKCRHFVLFILKEFLFYTAESSGCFDRILSKNNKWLQHKEIVRAGIGKCRDDLSWQCKNIAFDQEIDWTRIEYIYKKDDYDIKTGIIMKVHTLLLKTTEKVKKDSFENILMKKMTSIEKDITFSDDSNSHPLSSFIDTVNGEDHITLDQVHFIAYTMAIKNKPVMETKWFQVVGMTPRGLARLRNWIFCYYDYDIPDNALRKSITAFQQESMNDYIILKTMIKLIIYYRKDYIYHLPSSYAVRQTLALRRLLCIDPLHPTPPLLGVHYMCPGCLKFANPVIDPFDYDTPINEKDTLIINHGKKEEEAEEAKKESELIEEDDDIIELIDDSDSEDEDPIRYTNKKKKRGRKRRSKASMRKMYANNEIMTTTTTNEASTKVVSSIQHGHAQQQQQHNVPYFNTALYDINTGHLHCQRDYKKKKGSMASHMTGKNYVIMKGRRNGLIIESNIDRYGEDQTTKNSNDMDVDEEDEEEEDEEEDDEDMVTFNHEDELFFMPDESLDIGSKWDVANRLTLTTERMGFGDGYRHRSSMTSNASTTKKANTSKNLISRIVDTPMNQKYTCASPLIPIDMIGVNVNGKVLCVDCGCMVEVHNNNAHSYGHTCMRHATPSHHQDHPVWKIDRFSAKHQARNHENTRPNRSITGVPSLYNDDCNYHYSSNEHQSTLLKKHRQTEQYHPSDIVHQPYGATEHDLIKCHFCQLLKAMVNITVMNRRDYKLSKKPICYSCKHLCKSLTEHNNVKFLDDVERHIFMKNYSNGL